MKRLAVFLALGLLIIGAPAAGADNDDFDKLLRLAEQGDAEAQHKLGRMYGKGQGLSQNYSEAVKWYRKAAEQGLPEAQRSLGFMYAKGQGVPLDNVKANMWFNLAAAGGDRDAAAHRDSIARKMTRDQIVEAQKLAAEKKGKEPIVSPPTVRLSLSSYHQ